MKGSHWFIIFIVAFLVIMFAVEYHLPKEVCVDLLSVIMMTSLSDVRCSIACCLLLCPKDTHCRKDILSVEEEDTLYSRGILAVAHDMALTDIDVKSLLKMAERGNKVNAGEHYVQPVLEGYIGTLNLIVFISVRWLKKYATSLLAKR